MSKLLYSATVSLDGFIAGPGGDMQCIRFAADVWFELVRD